MKKLRILALFTGVISVCLCLLCLLSCSNQKDTPDTTYVTDGYIKVPIVPDKKDLPSYDDLCKIERYMTVDEVTQILGYPQESARSVNHIGSPGTSSALVLNNYTYYSSDGSYVIVVFADIVLDREQSDVSEILVLAATITTPD